jgi:hypothetical protein
MLHSYCARPQASPQLRPSTASSSLVATRPSTSCCFRSQTEAPSSAVDGNGCRCRRLPLDRRRSSTIRLQPKKLIDGHNLTQPMTDGLMTTSAEYQQNKQSWVHARQLASSWNSNIHGIRKNTHLARCHQLQVHSHDDRWEIVLKQ